MDIRKKIINIINEERKKISGEIIEIDENNSLISSNCNNIGLCSLETIQLLIELENIFNIEINYEEIDTIASLIDFIIENGDIYERIK